MISGKCKDQECSDKKPPSTSSPTDDESDILGVPYVNRQKWDAQPADAPSDEFVKYPPPYVIIAHTAGEFCYERSECVSIIRSIQEYHMGTLEYGDIGYNFLVGGDGAIYEGRGWDVVGAHTYKYNTKSIGIAFIGLFTMKVPMASQLRAAEKLIEYGMKNGTIAKDYKLLGHRQCIAVESPGKKLYEIIKTWPHWSPQP